MAYLQSLINLINTKLPWYQYLNHFDNYDKNFSALKSESIAQFLNDCLDNINKLQHLPLTNFKHLPITFVSQNDLPVGEAYESFIGTTGKIPTRDNEHDLLNGLIWLNFPKSKAVFNRLHTLDIDKHGIDNARTPLRNALTLFDENGGVVVSSNRALLENLQNFDWHTVFVTNRDKWLSDKRDIAFFPFGHALLEKLINPRKNITSHTLLIQVADSWLQQSIAVQRYQLDEAIAKIFQQQVVHDCSNKVTTITSKNFQPVPVMGIPSYCTQNQQAEFYDDTSVFRLPRATKAPILDVTELI